MRTWRCPASTSPLDLGSFVCDHRRLLQEFFELADSRRLFVSVINNQLVMTNTPPTGLKRKSIYFVKKNKVRLTNDNIAQEVIQGEFSASPLESLSSVSREVVLPILNNPHNSSVLPEVVAKDLSENFQRFLANMYVVLGQTKACGPDSPSLSNHFSSSRIVVAWDDTGAPSRP